MSEPIIAIANAWPEPDQRQALGGYDRCDGSQRKRFAAAVHHIPPGTSASDKPKETP